MKSSKYIDLISSLESDCKEIEEMIINRIKESNFEFVSDWLEDPYTLEFSFNDFESDSLHAYDIGRLEAFREIIRELNRITYDR